MDNIREQWLLLISTPLYIGVILFEILLSHFRHSKSYTVKDTLTNLYLMILNSAIDVGFRVVYVFIYQWFWEHRLFEIESPVLYWVGLFVGMDFLFYWLHRIDHISRFF